VNKPASCRATIIIPDVAALPWRALPAPGLYARTLSADPVTGARTAMIRMVPEEGYLPPATAHYHDTYEEILGIAGHLTFDRRIWLGRGSYVFHPAGTVHGFASDVPQDSTILSRVGPGHVGNPIPEPVQDDMYSVYEMPDPRAPAAQREPMAGTSALPREFLGGTAIWSEISASPGRAHGAAMVLLPAGWQTTPHCSANTIEIYTLSPGLVFEDDEPHESPGDSFVRIPAGAKVPPLRCNREVLAFVTFGEI
jgi:quercetin dioxygenase-like cupin family protein